MPDSDAFLTWLFLPAHFTLGWMVAGLDLMSARHSRPLTFRDARKPELRYDC
jgi:hypothetical protein